MRLRGRIYRRGRDWLAEIPMLDAMTQGRSRKDALAMAADLVESLANRRGFVAHVHPGPHDTFELSGNDLRPLVALVLRRKREASGLTLAQAAQRLGARSRNAYARYEQGASMPTVEQLGRLLAAVDDGKTFVLMESTAH